jgi:hypothetical protein
MLGITGGGVTNPSSTKIREASSNAPLAAAVPWTATQGSPHDMEAQLQPPLGRPAAKRGRGQAADARGSARGDR